jgi:hypothetical protein
VPRPPRSQRTFAFAFALVQIVAAGVACGLSGIGGMGELRAAETASVQKLVVNPTEVILTNSDQCVQMLVTAEMSDGTKRDVTRAVSYEPKEKTIVRIDGGQLTPTAEGSTSLVIQLKDGGNAEIPVTVKSMQSSREVSFANEVIPVLTKAGCNMGACHGKSTGQNGFALSLLGFDVDQDYDALVKDGRGRRVFPAAPEQSLLLKKGAGQVAHGGGVRLNASSREFALIRRWIEQGMPRGKGNDPKVERVEVFPHERMMSGATEQQLRVVAYFTDGTVLDVSRQAEYKSQQPDILKVEPSGLVTTLDTTGEGAVMVRYMGFVDVSKLSVPFNKSIPDEAYAHFQPKNFVDEHMLQKWKKLRIAPSPECSDEVFIRRAYLDAIGTLPTPDEVRAFLADTSNTKRDLLIDRILDRHEYADFWANMWGDLLRNKRSGDEQKRGTFAFDGWIRDAFAKNMPYDKFVGAILTAQGEVGDNPPVNWYRTVRNQVHLVNDTSQLFMGTRISCANCHNHPYEKLTQDDYWGFAAFFARIGKKQGDVPADQVVFVQKNGETRQPRSGQVMKPKGLNGPEYDYVRGEDPRVKLVEWLTDAKNPYFAKAMANRMVGAILGTGLVNSIDDMRATNPPSNPELLAALADDFTQSGYDIKHLIKTLMKSRTYSLSSDPTQYNASDKQNYSRYHAHRMSAEVMLDAIGYVTGVPDKFGGLPPDTRAIQLPDQAVGSYFLETFGRSQRESACECERSYAPNLAQILHLMNSGDIQNKLSNGNGILQTMLKEKKPADAMVEELFLRTFGRLPRDEEKKAAVSLVAGEKDPRPVLEDLLWTMLNSKEFLFNH